MSFLWGGFTSSTGWDRGENEGGRAAADVEGEGGLAQRGDTGEGGGSSHTKKTPGRHKKICTLSMVNIFCIAYIKKVPPTAWDLGARGRTGGSICPAGEPGWLDPPQEGGPGGVGGAGLDPK